MLHSCHSNYFAQTSYIHLLVHTLISKGACVSNRVLKQSSGRIVLLCDVRYCIENKRYIDWQGMNQYVIS